MAKKNSIGPYPHLRAHHRKRASGETVTYYYWDGRHREHPDVALGTDLDAALVAYRECEAGILPNRKVVKYSTKLLPARKLDGSRRKLSPELWGDLPDWAPQMFLRAEKRAHESRRSFTLTIAQFAQIIHRANGRCEVTGIPFDRTPPAANVKPPFGPSLDRIDCSRGYEFDNCRLVCLIVNTALSNWGEAPLRRVAQALNGTHST